MKVKKTGKNICLIICFSVFKVECALVYLMNNREKGLHFSNFVGIARINLSIARYNLHHFTTKSFQENMHNFILKFLHMGTL